MATETIQLAVQPREVTGKTVKKLRRAGIVPLAICGKGVEPINVQVEERELDRVLRQAGKTSLVEINLPGLGKRQAFFQELQRHPVTRRVLHADLYVVDMKSEMTHDVPVVLVGENNAVQRGEVIANLILPQLSVRALPGDLPHQIEIDISGFDEPHHVVHVSDIKLGDKIQLMTPAEDIVLSLTPARMAAEEETTAEEGAEEQEPELIRPEREDG